MRQDGVNIISDSWGACEPLISPRLLAAEDTSLELAAVAGISTYVATGDFGSTDCYPFTGSTNLLRRRSPRHSRLQRRSAGRRSRCRRSTRTAARRRGADPAVASRCGGRSPPTRSEGRSRSAGRKCRSGTARLPGDARRLTRRPPEAQRLHHLLQPLRRRPRHRLGAGRRHERRGAAHGGPDRRRRRGGRQAARLRKPVPLRPGRDERLPRHRLGHEQPLRRPPLHGPARATTWRPGSARSGPARSPRRSPHTRPARCRSTPTALHVAGPVDGRRIALRTQGHLPGDAHRHDHRPSRSQTRRCWSSPTVDTFRVRTNAAGGWSVTRSKAILRNLSWHAVYLGSDTEAPAATPTRRIYVTPHLGLTVQLPFRNGHYVARSGRGSRSSAAPSRS